MMDLKTKLTLFAMLSLWAFGASGQTRGISIDLRESATLDAPIVETVQLYDESYALVIGIDDYNNGWPKLSNAVKDAEVVASELETQGFEVELHRNLNSEQLATTFKRFFTIRGQNPAARLFVWFAGHGMTLDGEGYLVPADAPVPSDFESVGNFKFSAYFLRDFGGLMRAAKSKHAYAVFDACFAGTVFSSARALPPPAITRATTKPVRQFLTSGDANQEVSDDGTFRELFVRAIRGDERADANADGYVTASELGMYLNDRITNLTEEAQTPRYGKLRDKNFDLGDFVFVLPGTTATGEVGVPPVARAAPDPEIIFWNSIQGSENVAEFNAYLAQYPDGRFAELASARKRAILRKQIEEKREEDAQREFEVASVDLDMKASSTANVRARPFPSADRVGQLQEGSPVWVVGETRTPGGLWYQVARDGAILGFVYSPLLESITSVAEYLPIEMLPLPGLDIEQAVAAAPQAESVPDEPARPATIDDEFSMLVDDLLEEVAIEQESVQQPAAAQAPREMTLTTDAEVATEAGRAETSEVTTDSTRPADAQEPPVDESPAIDPPAEVQTADADPVQDPGATTAMFVAAAAEAMQPDEPSTAEAETAAVETVAAETVAGETPAADFLSPATDIAEVSNESSIESEAASTEVATTEVEPEPAKAEEIVEEEIEAPQLAAAADPEPAPTEAIVDETPAASSGSPAGGAGEASPALKRFIVAALAGDAKVQASLGYMYETGTNGVSVDKMEAVKWYKMAADNGEAGAMFNLALLYEAGEGVGGTDMTEAAFWYRRAADSGDLDAQQRLGFMYELGQGVMKDTSEAVFWYKKAALAGAPDAQQKLGYMYENGDGIEADALEAARWYERAALAGRETAQNNLARLYQLGIGVEKDLDRARYWYEKSAAQGNETANKNLATLNGS